MKFNLDDITVRMLVRGAKTMPRESKVSFERVVRKRLVNDLIYIYIWKRRGLDILGNQSYKDGYLFWKTGNVCVYYKRFYVSS